MGRPRKKVDIEVLKRLAALQMTDNMIAATIGMHCTTMVSHFRKEIDAARHEGRGKLVQILWQRAVGTPNQEGRITKPGSDRILEHCANRWLGAVKQVIQVDDSEPKDKLEVLEKLKEAQARLQAEIDAEENN